MIIGRKPDVQIIIFDSPMYGSSFESRVTLCKFFMKVSELTLQSHLKNPESKLGAEASSTNCVPNVMSVTGVTHAKSFLLLELTMDFLALGVHFSRYFSEKRSKTRMTYK